MALPTNFSKPAGGAAPAGMPVRNKWKGLKSGSDRDPQLNIGHDYVVTMVGIEPYRDQRGYKITIEVNESSDPSFREKDRATILVNTGGDAYDVGMGKIKSMAVALAGLSSDEEYDATDPEGQLLSNTELRLEPSLIGERAAVRVRQGNPRFDKNKQPTGEFWPEHVWAPLGKE